jgi:hypothetical protein
MRWIPPVTRDVLHTDVSVCRTPIDRELTLPAETTALVPDLCTRKAPVYDWACTPKIGYVPVVDTADRLCPVPTPCGRPTPRLTTVPVGTHLEQVPVGTQDTRVPVGEQDVTVETGVREVAVPGVVRRMEHLGNEIHLANRGQVVEKRVILPGRWVAEPMQVPVPGYWVTITCDPAQADGRTVLTRAQYDALVAERR